MGKEKSMYTAGTGMPDWNTPPCMQSDSPGPLFPQKAEHIRLNREFQFDITWWKTFAYTWNGSALILHSVSRECILTSDASGQWGCGPWQDTKWFQLAWDDRTAYRSQRTGPNNHCVCYMGHLWSGCRVLARCDNQSVVSVVNSRYSKDPKWTYNTASDLKA